MIKIILKTIGKLYRGNCGTGRFYSSALKRCVPASPKICKPGQTNKLQQVADPSSSKRLDSPKILERMDVLNFAENFPKRVICYLTSWAYYRKGEGQFVPEHLDSRLCTDVIYAYAALDSRSLRIRPSDSWTDIENSKQKYVRLNFKIILNPK